MYNLEQKKHRVEHFKILKVRQGAHSLRRGGKFAAKQKATSRNQPSLKHPHSEPMLQQPPTPTNPTASQGLAAARQRGNSQTLQSARAPTAQRLPNLERSEPCLAPSRLPLQPTLSTLVARTLVARTLAARTLVARTLVARTLVARTFVARTLVARTLAALTPWDP